MTWPLAIGTRKRSFCSFVPARWSGPAAEGRVGGDDQPERAPDAADLLDRDRVGERVEPGAALVLRDRDAEPAHLAEAADDLDREATLALVLVDDRRDLLDHEVADRRAQQGVLWREVEVHWPSVAPALRRGGPSASLPKWPGRTPRHPSPSPSALPLSPAVMGTRRCRRRLRHVRAPARHPHALRRAGATSPEQLATRLGASRTGVLQQLRSLEAAGLVDRRTLRHGVGRPRHLYDVTPDAQAPFPSNYDGLAAGLLAAIGAVGGDDLVEEVFDARRQLIAQQMKEPAPASGCRRARRSRTASASSPSSRTSRATCRAR